MATEMRWEDYVDALWELWGKMYQEEVMGIQPATRYQPKPGEIIEEAEFTTIRENKNGVLHKPTMVR